MPRFVLIQGMLARGEVVDIWINPDHVQYVTRHTQGSIIMMADSRAITEPRATPQAIQVPGTMVLTLPPEELVTKLEGS
jgi:hypothetical protein